MVKINDKRKVNNQERFGNLPGGATFLWGDLWGDGALFMKLCGHKEAVSLADGFLSQFDNDDYVIPVEIEINIIE